jgi:hypothetical protein
MQHVLGYNIYLKEHIHPSFQRLKEGIDPEQSPMLMDLTKYIEKT